MTHLPCSALPAAPFFFLPLCLTLVLSLPDASAVNRCERQGRITYTDQRCAEGERETTALSAAPAAPAAPAPAREPAAADTARLQRERAEVARMQALREQRERQERQIRDLAARGAAARERKCRALALQLKWREEDLREAPLDKAGKARIRQRRAAEKFDAECR